MHIVSNTTTRSNLENNHFCKFSSDGAWTGCGHRHLGRVAMSALINPGKPVELFVHRGGGCVNLVTYAYFVGYTTILTERGIQPIRSILLSTEYRQIQ